MKKRIKKIVVIVLALLASWEIFSTGSTWSFFSDIEISAGNIFQAGTLDVEVISPTENFVSNYDEGSSISSGYAMSREFEVFDAGKIPFDYSISTENTPEGENYCESLDLMANLDGEIKFDGSLPQFSVSGIEFSGASDKWLLEIYPGEGYFDEKDCSFKLVFSAVQRGEINSESGFSDKEEFSNTISSGKVVLNEIMADPKGSEAFGEWVELYNASDWDIDVGGWMLYDEDGNGLQIKPCYANLGSTHIAPHGFLVIHRKNGKNCTSDFTLNNSKDEVRLYTGKIDEGGILVDEFKYENTTKDKIENTFGRYPDGAGLWQETIPTPGSGNILYNEEKTNPAHKIIDTFTIGYLNGETEVLINDETGDILENSEPQIEDGFVKFQTELDEAISYLDNE